jgi:hypothetical protein
MPPSEPSSAPPAADTTEKSTRKSRRKVQKAAKEILLSPRAASAQLDHQDILFGTSSQLVREDSPTMIRHIQQALDNSIILEEQSTTSETSSRFGHYNKARRSLWAAANRDLEDTLLDESTASATATSTMTSISGSELKAGPKIVANPETEFPDIDEIVNGTADRSDTVVAIPASCNPPIEEVSKIHTPRRQTEPILLSSSPRSINEPSPFFSSTRPRFLSRPHSPTQVSSVTKTSSASSLHTKSKPSAKKTQPTDSETLKPKRPRGRPRKISADSAVSPKKTTKSRGKKAIEAEEDSASKRAPKAGTSTAKAQAKGKASQTEWLDIDEIQDSEPEITPSPPRRVQVVEESALEFSGKPDDTSWVSIRETLFANISEVIKCTQDSSNLKNPSWYEKILLYDPIDVDQLTTWLNMKMLDQSRAWSNGDIKELQPWMVQKWCEDNSICCQSKPRGTR